MDQTEILKNIDEQLKVLTLDQKYYVMEIMALDTPAYLYAGQKAKLIEREEEGFVVALSAIFSSPDARVRIYIDDYSASGTPRYLLKAGMITYNPRILWMPTYDDENKMYKVWFTPSPYMHYYNRIEVSITAPKNEDISYSYSAYRYVRRR